MTPPRASADASTPTTPRHSLDDLGGAKAERMRGAGGTVHLAGMRLPRRIVCTKDRPVPAAEYAAMAALGQRRRAAVAHQGVEALAKAAPATRQLQMFRPG